MASGDLEALTAANTAANAARISVDESPKPPHPRRATAPVNPYSPGTFEMAVPTMGRRATAPDVPRRKSTSIAPLRHSGTFMRV